MHGWKNVIEDIWLKTISIKFSYVPIADDKSLLKVGEWFQYNVLLYFICDNFEQFYVSREIIISSHMKMLAYKVFTYI